MPEMVHVADCGCVLASVLIVISCRLLGAPVTVVSGGFRSIDSGLTLETSLQVVGTVPSAPEHLVSRPRLTTKLDQGVLGPVTLLSAGPGSGKTVLLSDW